MRAKTLLLSPGTLFLHAVRQSCEATADKLFNSYIEILFQFFFGGIIFIFYVFYYNSMF